MRTFVRLLAVAAVAISGGIAVHPAGAIYGGSAVDWDDRSEVAKVVVSHGGGRLGSCGGTFVSDDWVLTAAHCVSALETCENFFWDQPGDNCYVPALSAGQLSLSAEARPASNVSVLSAGSDDPLEVAQVLVHPSYQQRVEVEEPGWKPLIGCLNTCAKVKGLAFLDWDFALLRLAKSAKFVDNVDLLDDKSSLVAGLDLTALGWGDTDPSTTKSTSDDLLVSPPGSLELGTSPVFPHCSSGYSVLCASGDGRSGTGQGDSGGPWFTTTADGEALQVGVTSFGPTTGQTSATNLAGIASVPAAVRWIRSNTGLSVGAAPTADNVATALVIDNSGSMSSNDPDARRREAGLAYINSAAPGDHVGVVGFENSAYEIAPIQQLPEGAQSLSESLDTGVFNGGGTNIGAGLTQACSMLNESTLPTRRAAILLTDGQGGYSDEAACFASKGWHVFTIGLGAGVNTSLLESIAQQTGGTYQPVPEASELQCKFQQVRALVAGGQASPCESDLIQLGQTITKAIDVAGRLLQFTVSTNWDGSDVEMTLVSPSGRRITRSTTAWDVTHSLAPTHEQYVITAPEPGKWTVELFGADIPPEGEPVVLGLSQVPLDNQLPSVTAAASAGSDERTWAFTAEASDPDGSIVEVVWDFGDGRSAIGRESQHRYAEPGEYHPVVTAVDDLGEASSFELPAVTVPDEVDAPTAIFSAAERGLDIFVDASASTGSAATPISSYAWDFDADGEVDLETDSPTASWTYQTAGEFSVWLGVTTSDGQADSTTRMVTVEEQDAVQGLTLDFGDGPLALDIPVRIKVAEDGSVYRVSAVGRDGTVTAALKLRNVSRNPKGICSGGKPSCPDRLIGVLRFSDRSEPMRFVGTTRAADATAVTASGVAKGRARTAESPPWQRLKVNWSVNK